MSRKKTIQDYHRLAQRRGFEWVGKELPGNVRIKTLWGCSGGHQWGALYTNIQQGYGCPYCAGSAPKIVDDYHRLAERHGFEWVGKELPKKVSIKTRWQCLGEHRWKSSYNNIQQGKGCPYCAGLAPKVDEDYHDLAEKRGFEWVGEKLPEKTDIKTSWRCSRGHEWETRYSGIQQGKGCPYCSDKAPKVIGDYHNLAGKREFKWIGEELPPNAKEKTLWKCLEGHEWETPYDSIQKGGGCPYCAGNMPKVAEDYYTLAEKRGFGWVGPEVPNTQTKTFWRCSGDHKWETTYNTIQQGCGCPVCVDMVNGARVSKKQKQLHKMMGGELNYPCSSYRIDVALPDKMVAIEYDCWYWHSHKQDHDAKRDAFLLTRGWKTLHIKTNKSMPSKLELDGAIAKLENGETQVEIVLDDWGKGPTFAEVRAQKKVDPWDKGPIPTNWDGGISYVECQQLDLW